jgi:hypothetical protein
VISAKASRHSIRRHPLNRAISFTWQGGFFFFVALYLAVAWKPELLGTTDWIQAFDFISLVQKWTPLSPNGNAYAFAMGTAVLTSIAVGILFGIVVRTDHSSFRRFVERRPHWHNLLLTIGALGIAAVPFLSLAEYDGVGRMDRLYAALLGNDITTAIVVGAIFFGYCAFWLAAVLAFRHVLWRYS